MNTTDLLLKKIAGIDVSEKEVIIITDDGKKMILTAGFCARRDEPYLDVEVTEL